MILDSQDESDFDDIRQTSASGYPIFTVPLTTNRDYFVAQTYNMLKIKDVSVYYDGVNGYRAKPVDDSELNIAVGTSTSTTQNSTIDANFSRTSPRYDLKFNAFWLYPRALAADVTAGGFMVLEWFRGPTEFTLAELTTGTAIPGFDSTFHAMLAYGPAFEYCEAKQLPQASSIYRELQMYEDRLRKQYGSKQLDRHIGLKADFQSYK